MKRRQKGYFVAAKVNSKQKGTKKEANTTKIISVSGEELTTQQLDTTKNIKEPATPTTQQAETSIPSVNHSSTSTVKPQTPAPDSNNIFEKCFSPEQQKFSIVNVWGSLWRSFCCFIKRFFKIFFK